MLSRDLIKPRASRAGWPRVEPKQTKAIDLKIETPISTTSNTCRFLH